jgi:hypothetical protein
LGGEYEDEDDGDENGDVSDDAGALFLMHLQALMSHF